MTGAVPPHVACHHFAGDISVNSTRGRIFDGPIFSVHITPTANKLSTRPRQKFVNRRHGTIRGGGRGEVEIGREMLRCGSLKNARKMQCTAGLELAILSCPAVAKYEDFIGDTAKHLTTF